MRGATIGEVLRRLRPRVPEEAAPVSALEFAAMNLEDLGGPPPVRQCPFRLASERPVATLVHSTEGVRGTTLVQPVVSAKLLLTRRGGTTKAYRVDLITLLDLLAEWEWVQLRGVAFRAELLGAGWVGVTVRSLGRGRPREDRVIKVPRAAFVRAVTGILIARDDALAEAGLSLTGQRLRPAAADAPGDADRVAAPAAFDGAPAG